MQSWQHKHPAAGAPKRRLPAAPGGRWPGLWVAAAVALVFADSSIVVLALPQIVDQLHTPIAHVTWVIAAYNLALITAAIAIIPFADRVPAKRALITGLTIFGLASLGAGAADSLRVVIVARCVQGAAGGLLACASLPMFAGATKPGRSALAGWAATAALGAAIGPAIGGLLTEIFDWRAIFLAQAPIAAVAGFAIATTHSQAQRRDASASPGADHDRFASEEAGTGATRDQAGPRPAIANLALAFISAALIGALFLVTTLLINVWQLSPLGAAAVVTVIPLATVLAERGLTGRSPIVLSAGGAFALAAGLTGLAFVSHRQIGWVVLALTLCGTGLGMAFPALTAAALRSPGRPLRRAARTVAARDAGLVLGLLILTPVFVDQLNAAPARAIAPITRDLITAPIPNGLKLQLGAGLLAANARASQSQLPDINPPFAQASDHAGSATRAQLATLETQVEDLIQAAATHSFKRPLLYCALFALLALLAVAGDRALTTRLRGSAAQTPARSPRAGDSAA